MLFVYDSNTETLKAHGIFEYGVSSDEYAHVARYEPIKYFGALLALHHSREQFGTYVHTVKKLAYGGKMLFCQYLGRCHDARLIAVAQSYEHGHKRHKRLARTYIALQQTVHLAARTHIVAYLVHHTFLCTGEFELEVVGIEIVELLPYFVQYVATVFATMVAGVAQNVELNIEQLFKLESFARLLHVHSVARIVNATHGLIARHKMQTLHDEWWQRLGQWRGYLLQHRLDQTLYVARRHTRLLHPFGGDIVGLHAHL